MSKSGFLGSGRWRQKGPWTTVLTIFLFLLTVLYVVLHNKDTGLREVLDIPPGTEYVMMNQVDLDLVSSLVIEGDTTDDLSMTYMDNLNENTLSEFISFRAVDWDSSDSTSTMNILNGLTTRNVVPFLRSSNFKVASFFWLVGWPALFEIMFWTWFGVLSSILFYVGRTSITYKSNTTSDLRLAYDENEPLNDIARFIYAPFTSLVIIFTFQIIASEDTAILQTSRGLLIVAFLLGFFSSRAMSLLDKFKEVLLPFGSANEKVNQQG